MAREETTQKENSKRLKYEYLQTQDEIDIASIFADNNIDGNKLISTISKINKVYDKIGMISSSCSWENIEFKIKEFKEDYSNLGGNIICIPTPYKRWTVLYTYLSKKEILAFFKLKAFL